MDRTIPATTHVTKPLLTPGRDSRLTVVAVDGETTSMLLVCGATGELGGRVARRLAARGVRLRMLVRGERPASFVDQLDVEVVHGDMRDIASLDRAVRGVTTVVSTVTAMGRALAGDDRLWSR